MQKSKLQFKIQNLRKKYPKFLYKKYSYRVSNNNLEIFFYFQIKETSSLFSRFADARVIEPSIYFKPKVVIKNVSQYKIKKIGEKELENLIFHLGLIEMISYWKATCSPEIIIKAGYLNKKQIKWWRDLIINGMGEFFYKNKINWQLDNFLKIKSNVNPNNQFLATSLTIKNRYLVPIGGGKDSIVTLELLKKASSFDKLRGSTEHSRSVKKDIKCFSLNPTEAAKKVIKIGECGNPIIVKRKIDKKLLELNQKGFLNGHTPFSAYLAFLSVLLAVIFDYKNIAFSNAKSADEGNVKYLGRIINHQWSKSFEFEKKFSKYSKKYLAKNVEYFSLLRHLSEIQIAELFSKYPKYFSVFLSCNKNIKLWCKKCPKCLFVFTILYPFIDDKDLFKIFGKNLFEDKKLLPIMRELTGERGTKPFECVGTYKESKMAFRLCLKKAFRQAQGKQLPYLLKKFNVK